jgi:hypothetical protein
MHDAGTFVADAADLVRLRSVVEPLQALREEREGGGGCSAVLLNPPCKMRPFSPSFLMTGQRARIRRGLPHGRCN